jgi:hypothetical protein
MLSLRQARRLDFGFGFSRNWFWSVLQPPSFYFGSQEIGFRFWIFKELVLVGSSTAFVLLRRPGNWIWFSSDIGFLISLVADTKKRHQ